MLLVLLLLIIIIIIIIVIIFIIIFIIVVAAATTVSKFYSITYWLAPCSCRCSVVSPELGIWYLQRVWVLVSSNWAATCTLTFFEKIS